MFKYLKNYNFQTFFKPPYEEANDMNKKYNSNF